MKTLTKAFAGSVAAATLSLGLATGTASAAPAGERSTTVPYSVQHAGGYTTGNVVFHDRSIQFTNGYVKSNTHGCVRALIETPNPGGGYSEHKRTACNIGPGTGLNYGFTTPYDKAGGANHVFVNLYRVNGDGTETFLAYKMVNKYS
ncbi:hypothetical protein ABZ714_33550 [Streptomyces sp. NPDC006798]|uniref:hypothetical protein n=1 Tax=Streptomyces sp. NPDC006798 TaxID=3155462 RepID=UPI0033ED36B4